VQAVEDYLNYTKISYFSLLELEERQVEKPGKAGRAAVLHIFFLRFSRRLWKK
jgi:hypothetical protein